MIWIVLSVYFLCSSSNQELKWVWKDHLVDYSFLTWLQKAAGHQKVFSVGQDSVNQSKVFAGSHHANEAGRRNGPVQICSGDLQVDYHSWRQGTDTSWKRLRSVSRRVEEPSLETATSVGSRPGSTVKIQLGDDEVKEEMNLSLHLASLCYIHVPRFLHEVTLCVDEFQSSITNLANSIQKAASDAAREFVQSKMPDLVTSFSPSMFNTMLDSPGTVPGHLQRPFHHGHDRLEYHCWEIQLKHYLWCYDGDTCHNHTKDSFKFWNVGRPSWQDQLDQ